LQSEGRQKPEKLPQRRAEAGQSSASQEQTSAASHAKRLRSKGGSSCGVKAGGGWLWSFVPARIFRTCIHKFRGYRMGEGVCCPARRKNAGNPLCIAGFFNAAGRRKTRPDGVKWL